MLFVKYGYFLGSNHIIRENRIKQSKPSLESTGTIEKEIINTPDNYMLEISNFKIVLLIIKRFLSNCIIWLLPKKYPYFTNNTDNIN